jgi:copper chaperone CopZ
MKIEVHNIKCGGCTNSIKKALLSIEGIQEVVIQDDKETIEITGSAQRDVVIAELTRLGYPEKGSNNILHKTKSFVSCAVGRMTAES